MARRNSAHGMHKTVRLLATGLAALILCGGMVLLFVQKERAAANAAGEPTAEPIAPTPAAGRRRDGHGYGHCGGRHKPELCHGAQG